MTTKELWLEYRTFLEKNVPASFANLAPGATEETIAQLEETLGVTLPESVKVVWRLNDGQKETMLSDSEVATPCIPTLSFLSTEKVASIWKHWGEVRKKLGERALLEMDAHRSSAIPGVVEPRYSSAKWIPLWADPSRPDYIGLDFDPGENGKVGQIINFGRNEDTHYVFAYDFDDLLVCLLEEVRTGNWRATELDIYDDASDEEKEVPWFGPTEKNFFNTLRARWKKRSAKKIY